MQPKTKRSVGIAAGLVCLAALPTGWMFRQNGEVHTAVVKACGTPGEPLVQTTDGLFAQSEHIDLKDGTTYRIRYSGGWGLFGVLNSREINEATVQPDNNVRC